MKKTFSLLNKLSLKTLKTTTCIEKNKALFLFLNQFQIDFDQYILPKLGNFDSILEAEIWLNEIRASRMSAPLKADFCSKIDRIDMILGSMGDICQKLLNLFEAIETVQQESPEVSRIKNLLYSYKNYLELKLHHEGLYEIMDGSENTLNKRKLISPSQENLCHRYAIFLSLFHLTQKIKSLDNEDLLGVMKTLLDGYRHPNSEDELFDKNEEDYIKHLKQVLYKKPKVSFWSLFNQSEGKPSSESRSERTLLTYTHST